MMKFYIDKIFFIIMQSLIGIMMILSGIYTTEFYKGKSLDFVFYISILLCFTGWLFFINGYMIIFEDRG